MLCLVNYRDGLDATTAPGAGPAGSVEQEAADLPLQAGSHLTPLTAPHNSRWEDERQEDKEAHLERHTHRARERLKNVNFSWNEQQNCLFSAHQTGKHLHMLMCLQVCSILIMFLLNYHI